ncbi:MAG TPA: hypothetical protein VFM99_03555 [Chitinophagales bacterium]|nr:hypothetical protein [Chitinophagales bacterium]
MKKRQSASKILGYTFALVGVVAILFLMAFNSERQLKSACGNIDISFSSSQELFFLETSDIEEILHNTIDTSFTDQSIKYVDLSEMEFAIEQNPFVAKADLFIDMQGNLHVAITQKQPIARIINKNGVNYYIDKEGKKFPVSNKFTSRVIVINGNINEDLKNPELLTTPEMQNAFSLVNFIHKNDLWNAQIEQIYVNTLGEFELVPKLGDHIIQFGSADNMKNKFDKLEVFYKKGLSYVGWEKYSTINLMYDSLVVCTKKQSL